MARIGQWTAVGVCVAVLFSAGDCFQWTGGPEDAAFVAACVDGNVTLPWSFALSSAETVQDIRWNFRSDRGQEEMIATHVAGNFLPMPAFSQRVQYLANGGMVLKHVTLGDTGNYTVEVAVHQSGGTFQHHRKTALVEVAEGLRVRQEPVAAYDPVTGSWHVVLSCGPIVSSDHSSNAIVWQTPSKMGTVPSTKYDDGHFYLQLENPIKGGNYSCSVAPHTTASVCSRPLTAQQEAVVVVDDSKARLSLLEAENTQLKQRVNTAETDLTQARTELTNTATRLAAAEAQLAQTKSGLSQTEHRLETEINDLRTRLDSLGQGGQQPKVSFHASMSSGDRDVTSGSPIILSNVVTNQGGAYDRHTGTFTAPVDGTYFIAASAGYREGPTFAGIRLLVGEEDMCTAYAFNPDDIDDSAVCIATAHMRAGQTAWVKSYTTTRFHSAITFFTGFLVNAD